MVILTRLEGECVDWIFIEMRGKRKDRADLLRLVYPELDKRKGVIISPGGSPFWLLAKVYGYCRTRASWVGIYDGQEKGVIITDSNDIDYQVGNMINKKLPCLECHRQGVKRELKAGSIYPYCSEHQNHAPERQAYKLKNPQDAEINRE